MTKRNPASGTTKSSLLATSASATPAPTASPVVPSQELTPEQKAATAAVVQAPPGAAEPFAAASPADVVKNVVADGLVAAAAAAGDPLAPGAAGSAEPGTSTAPIDGVVDGAERVLGAPDVADQLGGPIPRAPGVAAAAEHYHRPDLTLQRRSPEEEAEFIRSFTAQGELGEFDPLGDFAGRTLMVRSASDRGRRRAGYGFGPKAIPVEVDDLTAEQLGAIMSDPQLFAELLPREL